MQAVGKLPERRTQVGTQVAISNAGSLLWVRPPAGAGFALQAGKLGFPLGPIPWREELSLQTFTQGHHQGGLSQPDCTCEEPGSSFLPHSGLVRKDYH